jgi:tetratricopeptide (TPR) repeat protein
MSEPLRTPSDPAPATEAEREALIEKLLLAGLDHYFEGSYEQAVNVWTRVAFLERGHGRARAYIERARGALAERQRQAEELLHKGIAAYDAGDLASARDLLMRAIAEGGANETALVFLQRLGRLQPAELGIAQSGAESAAAGRLPRLDGVTRLRRPLFHTAASRARPSWVATVAVCVGVAASILIAAQPIASWLGERPIVAPSIEPRPDEPLSIVRASEVRLSRARELRADGRLREALRLLDEIDTTDPYRPEADRLRSEIQRSLLAAIEPPPEANAEPER